MKNLIWSIFYLFVIVSIQSCLKSNALSNSDKNVERNVEGLIKQMTLDEKIAELTQDAPANHRLGIPMMRYSECLHGLWLDDATNYPQAIALGSTWEPELLKEMTTQIAKEARTVNITHCYSPNLDVISGDARYGRVEESYGEDPYLVSRMGVAFIQGLQGMGEEQFDENHILATAKHYVGYPENRRGINGGFSDMSERRLREVHLPPFEAAIKEALVGAIMPGHQDFNGVPCHMNSWLINDILRGELGFNGFIVSDNNDVLRLNTMHKIAENPTEAAILGLKTGIDMDLVIGKYAEFSAYTSERLKDTVENNPELEKYIDRSVKRILTVKFKLGLFEDINKQHSFKIVSTQESQDVALKIAQKAIILLKNDRLAGQESKLLPLDKSKLNSIAVIGPNAKEVVRNGKITQLGGYSGMPPYYTSVFEGIVDKLEGEVKINYAQGCDLINDSKEGFADAVAAAKKSDVVVMVVGGSSQTCGEGIDVSELDLTGVQNELVEVIHKTGKPIVVVLINGRPQTINYIAENIPAILETWYLGMRSGEAIADALFGDVNPGGKLTVSFPRSVGQIPVTYLERPDFIGSGKGLYRFSDKTPLFSFGFGLSYTTFEYGTPVLSENKIEADGKSIFSVDIKNTGNRVGDEVVQMYVRDNYASVGRYNMMLKGFKRITLNPGETKTVSFELNSDNLSLLDKDLKKVVEPGDFTIYVGSSSREQDLKKCTLTVL
jgi:beta-glucosidase